MADRKDLLLLHCIYNRLHTMLQLLMSLVQFAAATGILSQRQSDPTQNSGIHLAVSPVCGALSATAAPADVNSGLLPLTSYTTLVCFGVSVYAFPLLMVFNNKNLEQDSYTDGGIRTGGPLLPAVVIPPNPKAGGRATNGPVWAEDIVNDTSAVLKDYAVSFRV